MKLYNLDEFRTSKLNYKTEEVCENLYLPDLKGKSRKLHSVLTYKMENGQIGYINRDENVVNNIIKILNDSFIISFPWSWSLSFRPPS